MKIIIAGGGKVGMSLVKKLSTEGYEVTLIDKKQSILGDAVNRYDVMAVQGNCAVISVLKEADVENADLLIAVLGADETNLLCCVTAHNINPNIHTIARIRTPEYNEQVYDIRDAFGLSMVLNPERRLSIEIERLLRYPGFLHRESFAKDRVEIVEVRVDEKSPLVHCNLMNLGKVTTAKVLVCVVLRDGMVITPDGKFEFEVGDRVFVTAPTSNLANLLKDLGIIKRPAKRVIICGGGRISYYLASRLVKSGMDITIIEKNHEKCLYLAEQLPKVNIIHGDATDFSLLESEGIEKCDTLIAMTGLDEMNMVISLYGNSIGVSQVITKVEYFENSQMLGKLPLGSIIDPKELSSNTIVRYVRALKNQTSAAVSVHSIADGQVEAQEFRLDETAKNCGKPLKQIKLKKNVLIVCIRHESELQIPDGDSVFYEGDTVIVVTGKKHIVNRFNDIFEE
ncbi:MAG: Trk system potassium transporter TrkA [Lachnospiraceae bacterium]|nr:Trk system potassium transporter TrkA [Lachnospiraceae bacterium]